MGDQMDRRALLRGGSIAAAAAAAAAGTSVMTAGPAAADPLVPVYLPIGPVRLYDSREEGAPISRNQTRNLFADSAPSALLQGVCFNVTITGTVTSSGFLAIFPGDEAWGGTSSINWDKPGQTIANNALTLVSSVDGSINVRCGAAAGGSTHFILDLVAYLVLIDFGAVGAAGLKAQSTRLTAAVAAAAAR